MASPEVLKIFDELKKLHESKDHDYAGAEPLSNFKRCEQFGIPAWKGCLIRLSDKWSRIVTLSSTENAVAGETIEDTLSDMAVYAVITLALLRGSKSKQAERLIPKEAYIAPGQAQIARQWNDNDKKFMRKEVIS